MEEIKQQPKEVKLVQKFGTYNYNLVIPTQVENKIRFACQQSWDTEWSGVLFYKYEGSFEKNNLVIKCIDFYVMDIGNSTYTEFNMDPNVANYMAEKDLLDCQIGLLHSHCSMSTFFSNTDLSTLQEQGSVMNNFVSLIVNNQGVYTAAITRRVKSTKNIKNCCSYEFFGEGIKEECEEYVDVDEIIEWYYLNIEMPDEEVFDQELLNRFNEIKVEKARVAKELISKNNPSQKPNFSMNFKDYLKSYPNIKEKKHLHKPFDDKNMDLNIFDDIDMEIFDSEDLDYIEKSIKKIKFDQKEIKSLVLQLLTCSLIVPCEDKINIEKWVNNMPNIYKKRFQSMKVFEDWADTFCEFITYNYNAYNEHIDLLDYSILDIQSGLAYNLIEELKKLPQNEFIKVYIKELEKYIYC